MVVDDLSTGHRDNVPDGVTFHRGDLRDADFVDGLFRTQRFDVVSHQAAQTSVSVSTREPVEDASVNVVGGLRLLDAAARSGVRRFVFASTGGALYGEVPDGQRARTDWPGRPYSPYACSKLAFEAYLTMYRVTHGLEPVVLRYANVYGPRQDPHGEAGVVAIFSQRIVSGQALQINGRREAGDDGCVRDYVYVGDVVAANVEALSVRPPGTYHVATGEGTTTRALADALIRLSGKAVPTRPGAPRAGDLERAVLEPNPDDETTALTRGLEATFAYFAR